MRRLEPGLLRATGMLCGLALGLGAGQATAQDLAGTRPVRGDSVMDRARPAVDPAGMRIGGFRADAAASIGIGYDDNLLGTNTARLGDGFYETNLSAGLVSEWTTHALGLSANITDRRYLSESNFDWTDWNVAASGRLDLATDVALDAGYARRRLHLAPQSIDIQQAGIVEPVPYDVDEFTLGGNYRINRMSFRMAGVYGTYRFQDVDSASGGNLSVNDYNALTLQFETGYEFATGRSATAALRWQDVAYSNAAASDRNSQTWAVLGGFRYDFDGVWQARVALGYARRDYEGSRFKPISIPAFEASVGWNVTRMTTLTLTAGRTIQESIQPDRPGYVSSFGLLRADHELFQNVVVSALAGLAGQEYRQPTQRAVDLVLGASAIWLTNRNIAVTLDYRFVNRFSRSGGIEEFDENTVLLRLRVAL
jgi:hypothetical protein